MNGGKDRSNRILLSKFTLLSAFSDDIYNTIYYLPIKYDAQIKYAIKSSKLWEKY